MNQQPSQPKQPLYQVLSLDVVLGSLAVGLFAVRLFDVEPTTAWWFILPCAVWIVYTLDHIVDGFKRKGESSIYRHRFHYQNRKVLFLIIGLIGCATFLASTFFLDTDVFIVGIILGLIVGVYLSLIYLLKSNKEWLQKEFIIALVYVCGIFLAPLVWYGSAPTFEIIMVMIILVSLAAIESIMISYYDYEADKLDNLSSFTLFFGKEFTRSFLKKSLIFIAIFIVLLATLFDKNILPFFVILFVMDLSLLPLVLYPEYFVKHHLFRWIGESVFFLPAFIFFF